MYSVYKKMLRKQIPVGQVYDARALRIIVDDEGGTKIADAWSAAYRQAHGLLSVCVSVCPLVCPFLRLLESLSVCLPVSNPSCIQLCAQASLPTECLCQSLLVLNLLLRPHSSPYQALQAHQFTHVR